MTPLQRQIRLFQLPAQPPLERGNGVMADAVDREQQDVCPADKAGEKRRAVLDPAVVMQEACAGALDQRFHLGNLIGRPPTYRIARADRARADSSPFAD